jgi:hypothetical protein
MTISADEVAMRREAEQIQASRPDAIRPREHAKPPPVIATVPAALAADGVEVCVRHEEWGVEVDVRPAGGRGTWTPIEMMGGSFEVRSS